MLESYWDSELGYFIEPGAKSSIVVAIQFEYPSLASQYDQVTKLSVLVSKLRLISQHPSQAAEYLSQAEEPSQATTNCQLLLFGFSYL